MTIGAHDAVQDTDERSIDTYAGRRHKGTTGRDAVLLAQLQQLNPGKASARDIVVDTYRAVEAYRPLPFVLPPR